MCAKQVKSEEAAVAFDTAFSVGVADLVVGPGATSELGDHACDLGLTRVLLFSDPRVVGSGSPAKALDSLRSAGVETDVFTDVAIEPTDRSFGRATSAASARVKAYDGFIAIGGGSVIDIAKAANLYSTYSDDFLAYVNPPIGKGAPPPGPLRPLIAIPTTAGTGT
jgi:alcohol dehydrogenase class IV